MRGFLSVDIDVSELQVNQCSAPPQYDYQLSRSANRVTSYMDDVTLQIEATHDSHKCHMDSMLCDYRPPPGIKVSGIPSKSKSDINTWLRGAYQCLCKPGYYSLRHPNGFNGTIMEVAYQEYRDNISTYYDDVFRCTACAPGCTHCVGSAPCLATYNWAFRMSLLTISVLCAVFTLILACYMYRHRKIKVFKVASPIFLTITLVGCAIMYLEVSVAIHS